VPVVSSDAGGLTEVNLHGKTGYVSHFDDVAAMTEGAVNILKSDATLAEFRKNALEQAKRFDIHHILPLYEALYQRTLSLQLA
jgi:glycosyltransferase involved in cell wall biosynthesis